MNIVDTCTPVTDVRLSHPPPPPEHQDARLQTLQTSLALVPLLHREEMLPSRVTGAATALCQNSAKCLVATPTPRTSPAITSLSAHTNCALPPPLLGGLHLINPHDVCHLHYQLYVSKDDYWLRATRQGFDPWLKQRFLGMPLPRSLIWSCQVVTFTIQN
jgi:hypothetical protein